VGKRSRHIAKYGSMEEWKYGSMEVKLTTQKLSLKR
jgi:hypothetical protein